MSFSGDGPVIGTISGRESSSRVVIPSPPDADLPALPTWFPRELDAALSWTGLHFADESSYVLQLTQSDLGEIECALKHFKSEQHIPSRRCNSS
jgi:hypothetical protein